MTNEQIQEARKLCSEATPGPWEARRLPDFTEFNAFVCLKDTLPGRPDDFIVAGILGASQGECDNDALFIARAHTLLPAALDEIERLQNALKEIWTLRSVGMGICTNINCHGVKCRSSKCKKAFMEHYLGGGEVG